MITKGDDDKQRPQYMSDKRYSPSAVELDWYRQHPEQLEKYADPKRNYVRYLFSAFVTGFLLTITSKLLDFVEIPIPEGVKSFVIDFLYDLGVSIWGAVAAIYMLEVSVEKQEAHVREWYETMKRELDK